MDIELREITGEDIDKIFGLKITGWSKGDNYNAFGLEGPGVREARLIIKHNGKMLYGQKEFDKNKALEQALDNLNEICDIDHQYWIQADILWCGNLDDNTEETKVCDVEDIESFEVFQNGRIRLNGFRVNKTWALTSAGEDV